MTVWVRRLIFAAALAWLVYALAVWAPATANGDLVAPTTSTVAAPAPLPAGAATVDGHDARWWAKRARRNGSHVRTLQHAIRGHVTFGARHLASVSASPEWLTHALLCIHGFEGAWPAHTGNGYFGGMQENLGFASTYGPNFLRAWGTPDRWPPFVQVAVAMNAYLSGRGFHPWPNTARFCGLLP